MARLLEIRLSISDVSIAEGGRNAVEGFRLGVCGYLVMPTDVKALDNVVENN